MSHSSAAVTASRTAAFEQALVASLSQRASAEPAHTAGFCWFCLAVPTAA